MKFKIVIPARFSSSRLPGKPLLRILDKPVVWHVIQRCKEAGISADDILVSTDDSIIKDSLKHEDIEVVLTSLSHKSGTDRINEVVKLKDWDDELFVINVQGDEPLVPPALIHQLISFTKLHSSYDITTAVAPVNSYDDFLDPNVVKAVISNKDRALYFTRSPTPVNRDYPLDLTLAKQHIGIYIYRVSVLKQLCSFEEDSLEKYEKLEQLRALSHGLTIGATNFDSFVPHGIDTIDDYRKIKKIMEQ